MLLLFGHGSLFPTMLLTFFVNVIFLLLCTYLYLLLKLLVYKRMVAGISTENGSHAKGLKSTRRRKFHDKMVKKPRPVP